MHPSCHSTKLGSPEINAEEYRDGKEINIFFQ
jgi:hypothetical protein